MILEKIKAFAKKETVFIISAVAAIVSVFFVPPCKAYLGYVDFSVIAMLFCLMTVVAGFGRVGIFEMVSNKILKGNSNTKTVGITLVACCFFFSMLVTNDVALLTFVPLTVSVFSSGKQSRLIFTVVMETVAANLGSLVTPIGNPQNLFLYSRFFGSAWEFFSVTLPLGAVSLVLIAVIMLFTKGESMSASGGECNTKPNKAKLAVYSVLFVVCLLSVLKVIDYRVCLVIVTVGALAFDRKVFKNVDYVLLLTFICFFVFVGNISSIESVRSAVSGVIGGREIIGGVLLSQIISNVPACVMLSGFTENSKALLVGVNIGGLGTVVASLASLISFKLYALSPKAQKGKYMLIFTAVNLGLLLVLLGFAYLVY